MADTSEFMDYDAVAAKMVEMKAIFDDYYKILSDLDDDFNYYIFGTSSVGLYSSLGGSLKQKWQGYASCFSGVKTEFDNWYNAVGETTDGNTALEEAAALYAAQAAAGESSDS